MILVRNIPLPEETSRFVQKNAGEIETIMTNGGKTMMKRKKKKLKNEKITKENKTKNEPIIFEM